MYTIYHGHALRRQRKAPPVAVLGSIIGVCFPRNSAAEHGGVLGNTARARAMFGPGASGYTPISQIKHAPRSYICIRACAPALSLIHESVCVCVYYSARIKIIKDNKRARARGTMPRHTSAFPL